MFYVDAVSIDYLTLTMFNPVVAHKIADWVDQFARKRDDGKKRMQYTGTLFHSERGTLFIGVGKQKNRDHYLCQCSGLLSDDLWGEANKYILRGYVKVTRLDLQITREYDRENWSQSDVFDVLRSRNPNRSVSYVESQSGPAGTKLATVYFGSRKSDRFVRLYEKMGLGEDVYLRFEAEYKGDRALAVAKTIDQKGYIPILANEIARTGYKLIADTFDLSGPCVEPKVVKPEPQTLKWLRDQVAPALDRVIQDHNIDATEVIELFQRILDDAP